MDKVGRVPRDAAVVVRPDRAAWTRQYSPLVASGVIVALAGPVGLLGGLSLPLLAPAVIFGAFIIVIAVLVWRSAAGFGPTFAADRAGVWIRAGGGLRPHVLRVPWTAVEAVRLHVTRARGREYEHVCLDVAAEVRSAIDADRWMARDRRKVAARLGTPLAVSGFMNDRTAGQIMADLRPLAPEPVRFLDAR